MSSTSSCRTAIAIFTVPLLLLSFDVFPVAKGELGQENQTLWEEGEVQKLKIIRSHLRRINKPAVRTIQVLITNAALTQEANKCCICFLNIFNFVRSSIYGADVCCLVDASEFRW